MGCASSVCAAINTNKMIDIDDGDEDRAAAVMIIDLNDNTMGETHLKYSQFVADLTQLARLCLILMLSQ